MNIKGINKAKLLAALYNNSRPLGMGFLHFTPEDMTEEQAQSILDKREFGARFDYLQGRVMKVDLSGDEMRTDLYNRDNGPGAAERVVVELKASTP